MQKNTAKRTSTVRLSAEQEAAIGILGPYLSAKIPDLAALTGDETLTRYSVLKIAISKGLKVMLAEAEADGVVVTVPAASKTPTPKTPKKKVQP
jgi:hypothetical protein